MRGDLLILSTRSMIDYAKVVAYHLETFPDFHSSFKPREIVGKLAVLTFADGEIEVEVCTSLRGKDVFLFAGGGRNRFGLNVSENKLELYHSIDALRRARAGKITLFEPYCSCARSDRPTRRNSVGFWVHYKTLKALGIDHIITYQLHSDKSKTIVDPAACAIDDIPIDSLMEEYITDNFIQSHENLTEIAQKQWLFCSVDAGSENLAKKYAHDFGCPLVVAHKHRDYSQANTIESINILSDTPMEGKIVWIVDDMIDTASSIDALVRELDTRNLASINVVTAHPVLSGKAIERLRRLYDDGLLQNIVVVDTIDCDDDLQRALPCMQVISSARLSAEVIMRIHADQSISAMFENFDVHEHLDSLARRLF